MDISSVNLSSYFLEMFVFLESITSHSNVSLLKKKKKTVSLMFLIFYLSLTFDAPWFSTLHLLSTPLYSGLCRPFLVTFSLYL